MRRKLYCSVISVIWVFVLICFPHPSQASFWEDLEKPKPEFFKEGDKISAKLIPRGKSTSVIIDFEVSGGKLAEVRGMDFKLADRPEVDVKNFRSAMFTLDISDVPEGGEVTVSVSSDFFTSSTQFFVFNERLSAPWIKNETQNAALSGRVRSLLFQVKDGGPLDSDGTVNGSVFLVGGPRDSFWGYALGTLFIRFFGIFLVLGILMIGMMLSGRFFQYLENKALKPEEPVEYDVSETEVADEPVRREIASETAAAIALALHLHFQEQRRSASVDPVPAGTTSNWVIQGRHRMMGSRFIPVQRVNRQ